MFITSSPIISAAPVFGSGKTACWWNQPEDPAPFLSDYSWQESIIGTGTDSGSNSFDSDIFSLMLSGEESEELEATEDRAPKSSGSALRRVRTINRMAGKVIVNRRRWANTSTCRNTTRA